MYIRTKDGIYEIDKNTKGTEDFLWVKTNKANIVQCVWLNCIINEADTIEGLCDQIVYNGYLYQVTLLNNCLIEDSFEELREPITDEMIKEGIYGAIWTSKGLIYVAKMNDKGKLELI